MLVRLLAKILCLPSQTSFVTICFGFVLEFFPSNLSRFQRIQRKARAGSTFRRFRGYNGYTPKYLFERLIVWFLNVRYIGRVTRSNSIQIFSFQIGFDWLGDYFFYSFIQIHKNIYEIFKERFLNIRIIIFSNPIKKRDKMENFCR